MGRILRAIRRILIAVGILVLAAAAAIAGLLWLTLPGAKHDTVAIPGLAASVSIQLDPDGIPWIRAGSWADAAAALGYLHARDRMFQMEMMRRNGSGRLSEIAGAAALPL